MSLKIHTAFFATMVAVSSSYAGTSALGFELGVSNLGQVKADLVKFSKIEESATSGLTGGAYLRTGSSGYDIDGLNGVAYIFDKKNVLGAIIISMNKNRFESIYDAVSRKYTLESEQRPYVGNQFARFRSGSDYIELDAPHLGFVMDATYMRSDIKSMVLKKVAEEALRKKKRDQTQF